MSQPAPANLIEEVKEVRELMAEIRDLARRTGTPDLHIPTRTMTASERKASGIPAPTHITTPRKTLKKSVSMYGMRNTTRADPLPARTATSGEVIVRDFAYPRLSKGTTPRRGVPRLSKGTTPSTLNAIQADMENLTISYRNTIGPSVFVQTQMKMAVVKAADVKKMKSTPNLRRRVLEGATKTGDGHSSLRGSKIHQTPLANRTSTTPKRSTPRLMTSGRKPVPSSVRPRARTCPLAPPQKKGPTQSLDLSCAPASSSLSGPTQEYDTTGLHKGIGVEHKQPQVTGAVEISRFIQHLHAQDPHIHDDRHSTPPRTTPPGSPKRSLITSKTPLGLQRNSDLATSTTPPDTPKQASTPTLLANTTTPKRCSTAQPKPTRASLLRADRFSTPRNRTIRAADPGASVTPSKAIVSALDRAIDAHLKQYAMEGKELTPAGQRISVLCEKRFGANWSPKKDLGRELRGLGAGGQNQG